jgi:hypothetical protein
VCFMKTISTSTLLEWKNMTKNLSTDLETPGLLKEPTADKLSYEMFCELFEDELYIKYMETGANYEMDLDEWQEDEYDRYESS